jgi:hypothetical protein
MADNVIVDPAYVTLGADKQLCWQVTSQGHDVDFTAATATVDVYKSDSSKVVADGATSGSGDYTRLVSYKLETGSGHGVKTAGTYVAVLKFTFDGYVEHVRMPVIVREPWSTETA